MGSRAKERPPFAVIQGSKNGPEVDTKGRPMLDTKGRPMADATGTPLADTKGILYVVSTPIGNLEDVTLRALRVLKEVDLIAAEGVQHTKGLCRHHDIETRLTSYNQHNRIRQGPRLMQRLKSGHNVALVTNAGTPGISDPGISLIAQALKEDIKVSPIPGPSAVTSAISASGLPGDSFLFLGFLSNRSGARKKALKKLISEKRTMVFFEAPHRIQAMLKDLEEIFGDRHMTMLREQTKLYEEVISGSVTSLLARKKGQKLRGEFTIVVAGNQGGREEAGLDEKTRKRIEKLMQREKMSVKDIATKLSLETGLAYRNIYKDCISIKKGMRVH